MCRLVELCATHNQISHLPHSWSSDRNAEIIYQLRAWWHRHEQGMAFDSNAGLFLPDDSMLSPEAAYIRQEKLNQITEEQGEHFLRVCPDFVLELLSASDTLAKTRSKMTVWMDNGAELGWLVDPYRKQVLIYEPGKDLRIDTGEAVKGAGPVEGFILNLTKVWRRFKKENNFAAQLALLRARPLVMTRSRIRAPARCAIRGRNYNVFQSINEQRDACRWRIDLSKVPNLGTYLNPAEVPMSQSTVVTATVPSARQRRNRKGARSLRAVMPSSSILPG
jgi:Uma2 family endonuclease